MKIDQGSRIISEAPRSRRARTSGEYRCVRASAARCERVRVAYVIAMLAYSAKRHCTSDDLRPERWAQRYRITASRRLSKVSTTYDAFRVAPAPANLSHRGCPLGNVLAM